jgi:NADPH-dependent curcumin reductase CurA
MPETSDFHAHAISLGPIGRENAPDLNKAIESYVPLIYKLIEDGKILPSEYTIVGNTGLESLPEAYAFQTSGKGGNKKVVVKIAEE